MQHIPQNEPDLKQLLLERRVPVQARIPKSLDRKVEIEAAERDISKQQLIEEAIRAYFEQKGLAA